ncbi:Inositolphosphorylceramide-B hydroxylase [Nadsonia fulvescens var. elongata DSM 6958]|uniref:Ceramide very long chain fatty acid hydroxylase n=1 Tax=Nadsonia fulvescens var. elongata DSM 6958 TaxID=857566 RepID=A0A1E3PND7_9ASCO|nr:Inositolphosphorylceramide-B hydroxylase [Nadsonia fulvescens var. elongata DSM 6958]
MTTTTTTRSLPMLTAAEIASHNSAKSCYVTINHRKVYDVSAFLDEHPGGGDLILEYAGKDITHIMQDEVSHEHSQAAYEALDELYLVGILATPEEEAKLLTKDNRDSFQLKERRTTVQKTSNEGTDDQAETNLFVLTDFSKDYAVNKFIDLEKPLLMQILFGGFSKEFYLDQVHRPRHYGKGSAPIFGNILEPLSLTAWYVVPSIWIPVDLYCIYITAQGLPTWGVVFLYALGLFIFSLIEYLLHRFIFHLDKYLPDNSISLTVHFLLHGVHHYLPMDKNRLVMPPTLLMALAYPLYRLAHLLFPYYIAMGIFSGAFMGYILYDCTHYFLHHKRLPAVMKSTKKYHLDHHYKNYDLGFGVTSRFWDVIFGTELLGDSPRSKGL